MENANFRHPFKTADEMLTFLEEMHTKEIWENIDLPDLELMAKAGEVFVMNKKTGSSRPMFEFAITTLEDRAENHAKILSRMPLENAVHMLNLSWPYLYDKKNKALGTKALIRGGRYMAFHSDTYAVLPQAELFTAAMEYADRAGAVLLRGSYTHTLTGASWRLNSISKGILDAFGKAWVNSGHDEASLAEFRPTLTLMVNDIGTCQIRILPCIERKKLRYLLGRPIEFKHVGTTALTEIPRAFDKAFIDVEEGVKKLNTLLSIHIENAASVFVAATKEVDLCAITKKGCKEVLSSFISENRFCETYAYDIYYGIAKVLETEYGRNLSADKRLSAEMAILRLLDVDFESLDKPGKEEF